MAEHKEEVKNFVNRDMRPLAEKIRRMHNEIEIDLKNIATSLNTHYTNNYDGVFTNDGDTVTTPGIPVLESIDIVKFLQKIDLLENGTFSWNPATKDVIEKICTQPYEG